MFNGKIHYKWPFSIANCEFNREYSIFHQNHGGLEPGMWIYGMIIGVLLMAEYIH